MTQQAQQTEQQPPSPRLQKLVRLLRELFQLDQPDLDFGIYRIMHAKSAEVTQFLEKDLLPQVKESFSQYRPAEKAALEQELAELKAGIKKAGMDPEQSPKVQELKARISTEGVDIAALEAEVFDHLYGFFRRYYHEGDFLSKRVYKPGVYAIPYEGEEVKLHWANADQYYIKTSEYLRDYAFRLRPRDDKNPMRVHFRIAEAAEGEHGNVKAANGNDRGFILATEDFMAEEAVAEGKELVLRFEYRPATLADWPEEEREGKTKPPTQKDLRAIARARILAVQGSGLKRWTEELGKPHIKADGTQADYSRLQAHLERYTARNTFDYFIHKDLGGFLRRELDFYIKNEVMHLDDIENETVPRVEQYLSKIKVIRAIAGKIVTFLAQLEDFQKKLWLKKKFVVETQYLITLKEIPEEFYAEIAKNDAQREEWGRLHSIHEIKNNLEQPGYTEPLTVSFLKAHPTLMLDSRYFGRAFTDSLVDIVSDVGAKTSGVLMRAENFQALEILEKRFSGALDAIYADPPYNTDASPILYKNDYKSSSWLSLVENRMSRASRLLTETGIACFAIDDEEVSGARLILSSIFAKEVGIAAVRANPQSRKAKGKFSPVHEYALFFGRSSASGPGTLEITEARQRRYPLRDDKGSYAWMNMIRTGSNDRREDRPKLYYPIIVDTKNSIRIPNMTWDDDKGEYVLNEAPQQGETMVLPVAERNGQTIEKNWHRGPDTVAADSSEYRVRRDESGLISIDFKTRMDDLAPPTTWWDQKDYASANYGAAQAKALFGDKSFDYPKAVRLVEDCLRASNIGVASGILDPFAGSGTTGHAVVNLNRQDGGQRKFILVEMGDHFDTVLVPRLKKATFTPEWKDGKPKRMATPEEVERSPRIMKIIRLESYEDAINNLEIKRTGPQKALLDFPEAQGPGGFREQYLLQYMLDVETRGSPSLLNIERFMDPTAYTLKVKRPGSDESREMKVDLLETFNWLIGLDVDHIAAPQYFTAKFKRAEDLDLPAKNLRRLLMNGSLKEDKGGDWCFRAVTGRTRDGRKTLIIWRNRPGGEESEGIEQDNLVLESWFIKQGYSTKDNEFDLIYVNGDNTLENLKRPDDTWKVRLIEEDFHRLMFDSKEP